MRNAIDMHRKCGPGVRAEECTIDCMTCHMVFSSSCVPELHHVPHGLLLDLGPKVVHSSSMSLELRYIQKAARCLALKAAYMFEKKSGAAALAEHAQRSASVHPKKWPRQ